MGTLKKIVTLRNAENLLFFLTVRRTFFSHNSNNIRKTYIVMVTKKD